MRETLSSFKSRRRSKRSSVDKTKTRESGDMERRKTTVLVISCVGLGRI
jgi:hypothetical protein